MSDILPTESMNEARRAISRAEGFTKKSEYSGSYLPIVVALEAQAKATYALAEQQQAANVISLLSSPMYHDHGKLGYNLEDKVVTDALTKAIVIITGKEPEDDN